MIRDNSITVYWACDRLQWGASPVLVTPPTTPAMKDISEDKFTGDSLDFIRRCPSIRSYYKNCFSVKSPVGVTIKENGDILSHGVNNSTSMVNRFLLGSRESVVFTEPRLLLFCEESCEVSLVQATFCRGDVACKTQVISGVMDISRWYRVLHPAFIRPLYGDIVINPDDTLVYLKFNTDRKIKFVEYSPSSELDYIAQTVSSVKDNNSFMHRSLANYYDVFKRRNMAKKILKEVKANIV